MRAQTIIFAVILCALSIRSEFVAKEGDNVRAGASAVQYLDRIYVTGGFYYEPTCVSCPAETYHDTTTLNVFTATPSGSSFELTELDEQFPSSSITRSYHTAVAYDGQIVLFGGATQDDNTLEAYNIAESSWYVIVPYDDGFSWTPIGEKPVARYAHGAAVDGSTMFVFGGFDYSGNALNDLWTFDFPTQTWSSWELTGISPSPRGYFSLTKVTLNGDNYLALFGGASSNDDMVAIMHNDLWLFNINTFTWTLVPLSHKPEPRGAHSATTHDGHTLTIFGGYSVGYTGQEEYHDDLHIVDLALPSHNRRWSEISIDTASHPVHRDSTSFIAYQGESSSTFFLFSGLNEDQNKLTLSDFWQFDFTSNLLTRDASYGGLNISDPHTPRYPTYSGVWTFIGCQFGYVLEEDSCVLDCTANNQCSGNGQCQFDGSCCCDENFSGADCSVAACAEYRGFSSKELDDILLPDVIDRTLTKLNALSSKLAQLQELLPSVTASQVDMKTFAASTYNFHTSCVAQDLLPNADCFGDFVGCNGGCGSDSICRIGDGCVDNKCIGGWDRDCQSELNVTDLCTRVWCEEGTGCQQAQVNCDDEDPCTEDSCDPDTGACVNTANSCDDNSCCTLDSCSEGVCVHEQKCEDFNPCTVDKCCETCSYGTCSYEWLPNCYLSEGQSTTLDAEYSTARLKGHGLELNANKVVPATTNATTNATDPSIGYFFLNADECLVIYDIAITTTGTESGAFFFGPAASDEAAGVVHQLPAGYLKQSAWDYCADGVTQSDLLDGLIYVQVFFQEGHSIRTQLTFVDPLTAK